MKYFKLVRYLAYIVLAVMALLTALPVFFLAAKPKAYYPVSSLTTGWIVERDEETRTDVSIEDAVERSVGTGESVVFLHALPEEEVLSAALEVIVEHASMRVFLDDRLIYDYGDAATDATQPESFCVVPLPEGYGGGLLSIAMIGAQENAFDALQPVRIGNRGDLFRLWVYDNAYPVLYGVFFIFYGLVMCGLTLYLLKDIGRHPQMLFAACVSLLAGFYTVARAGLFAFMYDNADLNSSLEQICLWLLLPSVFALLAVARKGLYKKIYFGIAGADLAIALVLIMAHLTGARATSLSARKNILLALIVIEGLFAVALMCYELYLKYTDGVRLFERHISDGPALPDGALLVGVYAIVLGALFGVVFRGAFVSVTPPMIGFLIFEGCMLLRYYFNEMEHLGETRRNIKLSDIAFTDPLTGHSNRAFCEHFMQQLDKKREPYCIINYDVNGLKTINDTLGHAEGDRFLKGFGQILRAFFKNADLVGRMGGDEFVVIFKNKDLKTGQDRAEALEIALHRMNRADELPFHYEASYGCAHSSEVRGALSADVYRLADDRMYEMKRIAHMRNGGGRRE